MTAVALSREERIDVFCNDPANQPLILRLGLQVGECSDDINRVQFVRDLAYTVGNAKAAA